MCEALNTYFSRFLSKIDGLHSIYVTDREGVPIVEVTSDSQTAELPVKPNFLSTFSLAIDQGSKLDLGQSQTLICSYPDYQIVQMNKLPLIVTFIASDTCNIGRILALESQMDNVLYGIQSCIGANEPC